MFTAIEAVGGLFIVPPDAKPGLVRKEVLANGLRALEVQDPNLDFLAGLPVEFLVLNTPLPPVEPVNSLMQLRGLVVDSWTGDLDFGALPDLEWFGVTEVARDGLEGLFQHGHGRLHHLAVGRYPETDLSPLSDLTTLTHLSVGDSRAFARLAGIEALRRLRYFDMYSCPALATVSGVESASSLQHVELNRCNRIGRIDDVAALPDLRSLQIEMDRPPPLTPLVRHPSLEHLWLVGGRKPPGEVISRLLDNPPLRFLASSRSVWMRAGTGWMHIPNIYSMTEEERDFHEQRVRERDAFALW